MAVTVVWKRMYDNYNGIFNIVLKRAASLTRINWLGTLNSPLWCIILILFTTSVGEPPIVLCMSRPGQRGHHPVEAAKVDGATDLQVFWKIMAPR